MQVFGILIQKLPRGEDFFSMISYRFTKNFFEKCMLNFCYSRTNSVCSYDLKLASEIVKQTAQSKQIDQL